MLFEGPSDSRLRHEWKHRITPGDKARLIARLSMLCKSDPHYGDAPYHIRSLYFDNVYDMALRERLDGKKNREKFRIRYYNGDSSYIVLEKKSKFGQLCGKASCRVTKAEVERLLRGDDSWLLEKGKPLCEEFYKKRRTQLLEPKVIVDYTRRAFVYEPGNTRITLDYDIRTGLNSLDFFNPDLVTVPADMTNPIILEVKYDEYFPEVIRDAVRLENRRTSSFSKYTACRLTNY